MIDKIDGCGNVWRGSIVASVPPYGQYGGHEPQGLVARQYTARKWDRSSVAPSDMILFQEADEKQNMEPRAAQEEVRVAVSLFSSGDLRHFRVTFCSLISKHLVAAFHAIG